MGRGEEPQVEMTVASATPRPERRHLAASTRICSISLMTISRVGIANDRRRERHSSLSMQHKEIDAPEQ